MDRVGVIKVVMGMNVGFVEDSAGGAGDAGRVDNNLRSQRLVKVRVHDSERDLLAISCRN